MTNTGVVLVLEELAVNVADEAADQQSHSDGLLDREDEEANALGDIMEALAYLRGARFGLANMLQRYVRIRAVQVSGLRALNNLIDANVLAYSLEEVAALRHVCTQALECHGCTDERVRAAAERSLGLLLSCRGSCT